MNNAINSIRMIVTHAGSFHADEVMAVALLQRFVLLRPLAVPPPGTQTETIAAWMKKQTDIPALSRWTSDGVEDCRTPCVIVRTRDPALLKIATSDASICVLDVGGQLHEGQRNFDHHQAAMTDTWPDGAPLSSTGLVWRWLAKRGDLNDLPMSVRQDIEDRIVRPLDAHDNGVALCALAQQCAGYNRGSEDPDVQYTQFFTSVDVMSQALDNAIHAAELKHEATTVLAKAWAKAQRDGVRYVALREALAYHDCTGLLKTISNNQALMLIIPGQGNRYSVISQSGDQPFSSQCPCPEAWRGQMNFTVDLNGTPVMVRFAHKTGFMSVVEGRWTDAAKVAQHVIDHNALQNTLPGPARPSPSGGTSNRTMRMPAGRARGQ